MMEVDTGGMGAGRCNMNRDAGESTQHDRLNCVISKLLMDHEALHATQTSATMTIEDIGIQLNESQRRHHADMQDLHESHSRDLQEFRRDQDEHIRTEIMISFTTNDTPGRV